MSIPRERAGGICALSVIKPRKSQGLCFAILLCCDHKPHGHKSPAASQWEECRSHSKKSRWDGIDTGGGHLWKVQSATLPLNDAHV